ncbi:MAG: PUA domain-containing protein [Thermocladium sp.]
MDIEGISLDDELYRYLLNFYSDSELDSMIKSLKRPPSRYYIRTNTIKTSPENLLTALRNKGIEAHQDEALREALWIPVNGPNHINSARKVVIANKQAAESVYIGANLYGPGVLYADPIQVGEEVNVAAPNGEVVAIGVARMDRSSMLSRRPGIAVEVTGSIYMMPKLRELSEYREGLFYEQSLPAQWVSHVLAPIDNELIIDMNAAPGGKMSHIIQLTQGRARVIGVERHAKKITQIKQTLDRLGASGEVIQGDSRFIDLDRPELVGRVDRALIDPPCSDIGVRPKIFDVKTIQQVKSLSQYQRQFIKTAHKLLKPGGVLVYSTCTVTPMENEDNIKYANQLGFSVETVDVPGKASGIGELGSLVARFYPHQHDSPGFFIARLRKT